MKTREILVIAIILGVIVLGAYFSTSNPHKVHPQTKACKDSLFQEYYLRKR